MWLHVLWQRWCGCSRSLPRDVQRRRKPRQWPTARLHLEVLEDRTLLSNYTAGSAQELIADITLINQNPGSSDTITLTAPTNTPYVLNNATGPLPVIDLGDNLTIVGNGDTIERGTDPGTQAFRLFDVSVRASLTLQDLTLQNGLAEGPGTAAQGGAVYNSGNLILTHVLVQNNQARGSNGVNGTAKLPTGDNGSDAAGGGIYSSSGSVTLQGGTTLQFNYATGGSGGNGIKHTGVFSNGAGGLSSTNNGGNGGNGGNAQGGGLYVAGGGVTLNDARLYDNRVVGGFGGDGADAQTGPISAGPFGSSVFAGGSGGNGGNGGSAAGGGLYVEAGSVVTLTTSSVDANNAVGGNAGVGGVGIESNGGRGGSGGSASGGGLAMAGGDVTLTNIAVSDNSVSGGNGFTGGSANNGGLGGGSGYGGSGSGGGLYAPAGSLTLNDDLLSGNSVSGGQGGGASAHAVYSPGNGFTGGSFLGFAYQAAGFGGEASGGGLDAGGIATLNNDTLANNSVVGGAGGTNSTTPNPDGSPNPGGTGGGGFGGGMVVESGAGPVTLRSETISGNSAQGGAAGIGTGGGFRGAGTGGGLNLFDPFIGSLQPSNTFLANTLIAGNTAEDGGPDVLGKAASSDHDLIGNSSGFSARTSSGDFLNVSAGLDPSGLTDNDGPTLTLALLPTSLAIDAGDNSVSPGATDQRGYARIVGNAIDIGAYEFAGFYGGYGRATTDLSVSGNAPLTTPTGGQITYNLTVTNNSSTAQTNVTLADLLPTNTTLVSFTPAAGWSSSAPAAGNSGTVSAWIASLAGNSSANFTLVVRLNNATPTGTVINNTTSVGPITGDPNAANNSVTFNTTVVAPVDMSSKVKVTRGGFHYDLARKEFVQTVTITNTSASTLTGPLALELTGLSSDATLANASGTINGNPYLDFTGVANALAPGQSVTVTLYFQDPTKQSITYGPTVLQGI